MGLRFTILIGPLKEDVMEGLFHETVEDTMNEIQAIISLFQINRYNLDQTVTNEFEKAFHITSSLLTNNQ